jgi:hypothetical protein
MNLRRVTNLEVSHKMMGMVICCSFPQYFEQMEELLLSVIEYA